VADTKAEIPEDLRTSSQDRTALEILMMQKNAKFGSSEVAIMTLNLLDDFKKLMRIARLQRDLADHIRVRDQSDTLLCEVDRLKCDLKQQIAISKERIADNERLLAENEQLREKLAKMQKPVTDREWLLNSIQCEGEHVGKRISERVDIDDIIAARATQPKASNNDLQKLPTDDEIEDASPYNGDSSRDDAWMSGARWCREHITQPKGEEPHEATDK